MHTRELAGTEQISLPTHYNYFAMGLSAHRVIKHFPQITI
jgi:hypothetical protein